MKTFGRGQQILVISSIVALPCLVCPAEQPIPAVPTVVVSEGRIPFRLKSPDTSAYSAVCQENICYCDSDVKYLQIQSSSRAVALTAINDRLRADADPWRCKYLDAAVMFAEEVSYRSPSFLSVVEHSYSQEWNTGGSCHGASAVRTFDLSSGKEYLLGDVISVSSVAAIRELLPEGIVSGYEQQVDDRLTDSLRLNPGMRISQEHYVDPPEQRTRDLESARNAVQALSDSDLLGSRFFIKGRRVFLNVEGYFLSCAAGPFHPAEVPDRFITLTALHDELTGLKH